MSPPTAHTRPEPWTRLLPRQKTRGQALRASPTLPGGQSWCKTRLRLFQNQLCCSQNSFSDDGRAQGLAAAGLQIFLPASCSAGCDAASSGPQAYNPLNEAVSGINPWGPVGEKRISYLGEAGVPERSPPMARIYKTKTWRRDGFLLRIYRGSTTGLCQGHRSAPPALWGSCLCLDMRPAGSPH